MAAAYYVLKKKSVLNAAKLYTEEQVEELEGRIDELWQQLNSARACLMTYSEAIKHMTNEGTSWSYEMRMDSIRESCDRLWNESMKCGKVMHNDQI